MGSKVKLELPSKMDYLGIPDAILMEIGSDLDCCTRALEELGRHPLRVLLGALGGQKII